MDSGFRWFGGSCGKCQLRYLGVEYVIVAITYGKPDAATASLNMIDYKMDWKGIMPSKVVCWFERDRLAQ